VIVLLLWVLVLGIAVQNLQQPSSKATTVYVAQGMVYATNADQSWEQALFPLDDGCRVDWQYGDQVGQAYMADGVVLDAAFARITTTADQLPAASRVLFRFDTESPLELVRDYPQTLLYNDTQTIVMNTICNEPLPPTLYVVYVENETLYIANTHTLKRVELMPLMQQVLWSSAEARIIDRTQIPDLYAEPSHVAWLAEGAQIIGMFEAIPFVEVYDIDPQQVLLRTSFGDIVLLSYE
jgi:hypothetical protein